MGALAVAGLQKRLLSSIEAFAKTLAVHRRGVLRALEEARDAEELPDATLADLEAITSQSPVPITHNTLSLNTIFGEIAPSPAI